MKNRVKCNRSISPIVFVSQYTWKPVVDCASHVGSCPCPPPLPPSSTSSPFHRQALFLILALPLIYSNQVRLNFGKSFGFGDIGKTSPTVLLNFQKQFLLCQAMMLFYFLFINAIIIILFNISYFFVSFTKTPKSMHNMKKKNQQVLYNYSNFCS